LYRSLAESLKKLSPTYNDGRRSIVNQQLGYLPPECRYFVYLWRIVVVAPLQHIQFLWVRRSTLTKRV
jgi:hypothetical protein